jgi:hypothetical protein
MRLSLTVALILAVIGEMLSGQEGLGTSILLAARAFARALCRHRPARFDRSDQQSRAAAHGVQHRQLPT